MDTPSSWYSHRKSRLIETKACPNCKDFDWDELQRHPWDNFFTRAEELALSAATGCTTCKLLLEGVEHCFPLVKSSPNGYKIAFHGLDGPMRWDVVRPGEDMLDASRQSNFMEIFSKRDEYCPWPLVGPAEDYEYNLQAAAQQAREWLSTCQGQHPQCGISEATTLPKRVVKIRKRDIQEHTPGPQVHLYETQNGERGDYVCLSHCWGKKPIITTTSDNIARHKREIEWSDLSATFKDASRLALKMGIENIWIDSLCIIQNSREDWESEAIKMASYYTNGQFTIAATSSVDGAGGLFRKLAPEEETLQVQGWDAKSETEFAVGVRRSLAHHHDVLEDKTKTNERFPLLTRGWVYQERILSRRFIHFGPREIHWECHEDVLCQCGGIKAALELNPTGKETANQALAIGKKKLPTDKAVLLWCRQVESLTRLDFTYISDHLPALAGLATLMVQSTKFGRYLAGLWEERLLFWLCWATTDKAARPKTLSVVPSWSWASISGRISYDFMTHYFQTGPWGQLGHEALLLMKAARVEIAECVPRQPPLSGKLEQGVLALTGDFVQATAFCKATKDGDPIFEFAMNEHSPNQRHGNSQFNWPFMCDCREADTMSELDGKSIIVMHLLSYERLYVAYDGPYWMRSMLILSLVDGPRNLYRRVGILYTDVTGNFTPGWAWRRMREKHQLSQEELEGRLLQTLRQAARTETVYLV